MGGVTRVLELNGGDSAALRRFPGLEIAAQVAGCAALEVCPVEPNFLISVGKDRKKRCRWDVPEVTGIHHAARAMQVYALAADVGIERRVAGQHDLVVGDTGD